MVTSINASKNGAKPFVIERRKAILVFDNPDYEGVRIEAKLDVNLETFLNLQTLANSTENEPENLRQAFRMFGDQILTSWNLQDEDGANLPADAEGFLALPPHLGTAILGAWANAATLAGERSAST